MSTKRNKLARALSKKSGMSHQAALNALPQVIKSFHTDAGTTFSVRCKSCGRWIWAAKDERDGACSCGQGYRIVFGPEDWSRVPESLSMGLRCMDCGTECRPTQPHEGRNPWHTINPGQSECNRCFISKNNGSAAFEKEPSSVLQPGEDLRQVDESTMPTLRVYCDGSITNAVMTEPFKSHLSDEYVARAMVIVPDYDMGLIEQTRDGVLTARGTPNSTFVELLAVRTAIAFCTQKGIETFVVYSDCQSAVENAGDARVRWASRRELYLPNAYFDRVLGRAGYLRQTEGKVQKRRPPEPHQIEAFELFQAPRREFRLSESPLWSRVRKDMERRHPEALR